MQSCLIKNACRINMLANFLTCTVFKIILLSFKHFKPIFTSKIETVSRIIFKELWGSGASAVQYGRNFITQKLKSTLNSRMC